MDAIEINENLTYEIMQDLRLKQIHDQISVEFFYRTMTLVWLLLV